MLPPEVQDQIEKPKEPKTDTVPVIPSTVADDPRNEIDPNDIVIPTKPTIEPGTIDTTPPEIDTTSPTPPPNTDASIKKAQDELTPDLTPTDTEKDAETDAEKDDETQPTITPATDPQSEPGRPGGQNQDKTPPSSTVTKPDDVTPVVPPVPKPTSKIEVDPTTKNIATKVDTTKKAQVPKPPFNILGLGGGNLTGGSDIPYIKPVEFKDPLNLAKWKKFN